MTSKKYQFCNLTFLKKSSAIMLSTEYPLSQWTLKGQSNGRVRTKINLNSLKGNTVFPQSLARPKICHQTKKIYLKRNFRAGSMRRSANLMFQSTH